uniref:Ig-like domain-containing protein n=1 Tax=Sus scrofa TaxID=9823 RepID=A0A4X1W339_PIG
MPQPSILADNIAPMEDMDSVTLTCVPPKSVAAIRWFKDSDVLSTGGRGELSPDHRFLTLQNITRNDTGLYQCEASNSATSSLSNPLPVNMNYQGSCVFSPEKIQTIQHGVMIQKAGYYLAIHHLTSYPVKEEKTHKLHVQRRSNWDVNSETAGCHGTHGSLEI